MRIHGLYCSIIDNVLQKKQCSKRKNGAGAIRWHTTGKPDMTLLEKIIYLADFVEPTRDFPGVEELRELCFEDIDAAMAKGLEMSLEFIRSGGAEPYKDSVEACEWYAALVD